MTRCHRPMPPTRTADAPMTRRPVVALSSGCRRKRHAEAEQDQGRQPREGADHGGRDHAGPGDEPAVHAEPGGRDERRGAGDQRQAQAVTAVGGIQVAGASPDGAGRGADQVGQSRARGRGSGARSRRRRAAPAPGRTGRRAGAGRDFVGRLPATEDAERRVDFAAGRDGRAGEDVREAMLGAYWSDPTGNGSHTRHTPLCRVARCGGLVGAVGSHNGPLAEGWSRQGCSARGRG